MSTTFLLQIINSRLLRVVIGGKKVISLLSLNYNNNLPPKICYENIVKNVVDAILFFHNIFIFSCGNSIKY